MSDDRPTALFYELFSGLPRQGPGGDTSTLRALALVPGVGPGTRVLDIGCGSGAPTLVLAQHLGARITAIDNHPPFIRQLEKHAHALGLADRIDARVADMRELDFAPACFDLIWCEGAVFVVGFEAGLRAWRALLRPGGHLAVTEACWTKPDPPRECLEFWAQEYPGIRDVPTMLGVIGGCGYDTVGHFTVPPSQWWNDYYRPLQENITAFRARHHDDPEAQALADHIQREIDTWHACSEYYSYEFFVMRSR